MTDPADRKRQRSNFAKSTAIEYQKRVETVRRLLLSGMDHDAICQNVTAEWHVSERMVRRYILVARAKNQAWIDFNEAEMFSEHIAIRRHLRQKAEFAGDLKTALASAIDEAKMFG